jgi:hypothetical protein
MPAVMRRIRWVLACAAIPRPAFACSGDGAMERITANERIGWILWLVTLAIAAVVALRLRRGWRKQWPLAALVVIHPGWWLSARSGDCGITLFEGSIAMTIVTLVVGCVMWWRGTRK